MNVTRVMQHVKVRPGLSPARCRGVIALRIDLTIGGCLMLTIRAVGGKRMLLND